jgi:NAD(P)-dependent dehydrogenase (short-subunit alcohol dehydrogenase family)
MKTWTASQIPSLHGKTAVITGTGGLGLECAIELARAGAHVILAGRNAGRGAAATHHIRQAIPNSKVSFEALDLASLDSIEAFAARMRLGVALSPAGGRLDLLINNAGVMTPPKRRQTVNDFELQFGTNYLGHFALTAQLLPLLRKSSQPRVVTVSSIAARQGSINFDDLQSKKSYKPMVAYSQSKLACLIFALELQRRSVAGHWGITSIAAHPGISRTDLLTNGAGAWSPAGLTRRLLWFLFQPTAQGALPSLYAATSPAARGGAYYGPNRFSETRGHPAEAQVPAQALDPAQAACLWRESEHLTDSFFPARSTLYTPASAVGKATAP